jgi:hypothetical protein
MLVESHRLRRPNGRLCKSDRFFGEPEFYSSLGPGDVQDDLRLAGGEPVEAVNRSIVRRISGATLQGAFCRASASLDGRGKGGRQPLLDRGSYHMKVFIFPEKF